MYIQFIIIRVTFVVIYDAHMFQSLFTIYTRLVSEGVMSIGKGSFTIVQNVSFVVQGT